MAAGRTGGRALRALLGWVVAPLLLLCALVIVVVQFEGVCLGATADATGTFVAGQRTCTSPRGSEICSWYGTYSADDGSAELERVLLDKDPPGWNPGSSIRVVFGGDDPAAVYVPGDKGPLIIVIGLGVLSLFALMVWSVALVSKVRRRRPPNWIAMIIRLIADD